MRILSSPDLSKLTTLGLGGKALAEITLEEAVDVYKLPEICEKIGGSPCIIAGGSNILAADGEHPLVIIRPCFAQGPTMIEEKGGKALIRVGAGVKLQRLLGFCANHELSGLEGLCGIPGTVGGAVAMNAGSFGVETGEKVHNIRVFTMAKGVMDISSEMIDFGYRKTDVLGVGRGFLIIHALFALTRAARNGITGSMRQNFIKKKSTQPIDKKSAGCIFKNPGPGKFAGRLLEEAGYRGKGFGGVRFSEVHANFLINEGDGSAVAAFDLIAEAQAAVKKKFGINLELEVKVLPENQW